MYNLWPKHSLVHNLHFGPRANAELVPKFHITLHTSPCTNVTLTFDFDLGWITLFMGDMGDGTLHQRTDSMVISATQLFPQERKADSKLY
jgi:hypothetical protein